MVNMVNMYQSLRKFRVQQMIDDLAVEAIKLGHADTVMLQAYADEAICGADLLSQVRQFNTMFEYHDWWLAHQDALLKTPNLVLSEEYVITEFKDFIRQKHSVVSTERAQITA